MRLHLGSGSVFLRDYVNVDLPSPKTFLASERPDLVERWITDESDYYGRHKDVTIETLREGPLDQEYVCDRYGSFEFLPVRDRECDSILSVHAFEHLSASEAHRALDLIWKALKPSGTLTLDVPDHAETLRLLVETHDPFYIRHILGPKRDAHGVHMQSYSAAGLRELVEQHWFRFESDIKNVHLYPSIAMRFRKN